MNNLDYKNFKTTLRKASISRNLRTSAFVGAAASGLALGGAGLATSSLIIFMYLLIERSIVKKRT